MTIFAVVFVFGMRRKMNRLKMRPRAGASTTTDRRNDAQTGKCQSWTMYTKT